MNERLFLWTALACYAAASAVTARRLQRREAAGPLHGVNVTIVVVGFILHTLASYLRGQHLHRCPVTNLFEVQTFIAWSAVLFYLLIGPSYRVSFLGAFTAPLVTAVLLVALLAPVDLVAKVPKKHSGWVEFHAAIGIVACGALALACVIGLMYLVQERQLKSRHPGSLLLLLPAVDQLDVIGIRLTILGFALLTVGMIGGAISHRIVGAWPWPKTAWAVLTWVLYGGLLAARVSGAWRGRKGALGAIVLFAFTLAAFWEASWATR
jgi:ABC-type uncharacterized transport system permease subunit